MMPLPITAKASAAFADERENEVVSSEPRFGSKVNPHSAIKVYFLTQAVIEQSKILSKTQVQEFQCPDVIGLNLYEAREDLEALGLRLSEKLEKPNLAFIDKEDGQVTRLTNPNGQKLSSKLKTGDRVTINYVSDEVIEESLALKSLKEKGKQERFDNFEGVAKNALKGINHGVVEGPQHLAKNIKNPFKKKTDSEVSE